MARMTDGPPCPANAKRPSIWRCTPPCLGERTAVEQRERQRDEEKDDFVERPRNREKAESRSPSKRPRDALVSRRNPHGAKHPSEEVNGPLHHISVSVVRRAAAAEASVVWKSRASCVLKCGEGSMR